MGARRRKGELEMASELEIKAAIAGRVAAGSVGYSSWTIGVTDDPVRRKGEHSNTEHWMQWKADSEAAARNVEKYFLDKGMKGGTGGSGTADYVYIF